MARQKDDIEKVREMDEKRYARRRSPDADELERKRRIRDTFFRALNEDTTDQLEAIMRVYGWEPGSDEWNDALRVWRKRHGLG